MVVTDFVPVDNQASCLNIPFNGFPNEEQFNHMMTPVLRQIMMVQNGDVLVNTERRTWLRGVHNEYKPDFLVIHMSFAEAKRGHIQDADPDYVYGGLRHDTLVPEVRFLLEGKIVPLCQEQTGIQLHYDACRIQAGCTAPRSLLYNTTEWHYHEYDVSNTLCRRVHGLWTQPGSMKFLQECVLNAASGPLSLALHSFCNAYEVNPVIFLGRGRFGHAFSVKRQDNTFICLKIVLRGDATAEFQLMKSVAAAVPKIVMQVVGNSLTIGEDSGYLMSEVGENLNMMGLQQAGSHGILLLSKLHAKRIAHGDPRLQNIVIVNGACKWIDLRDTVSGFGFTKFSVDNDIAILFRSIYCFKEKREVDVHMQQQAFKGLLDQYYGDHMEEEPLLKKLTAMNALLYNSFF